MKKIIVLVCLLFCGYLMADGAFGTYKGMTKEELEHKGIIFSKIDRGGYYYSNDAPLKDNNFNMYKYKFKKNSKLCAVAAYTNEIKDDNKGTNIKKEMIKLAKEIDKNYGEVRLVNATKGIPEDQWMSAMSSSNTSLLDYLYGWVWIGENDENKKNPFILITVSPLISNDNKGSIMILYVYKDCF